MKRLKTAHNNHRTIHYMILTSMFIMLCSMTECVNPDPVLTEMKSIEAVPCDFSGEQIEIDLDCTSFAKDAFVIGVFTESEEVEYQPVGCDIVLNPLLHPVTDIRIITIGNFSDKYPPGSIINELFMPIGLNLTRPDMPWPNKGNADTFISYDTQFGSCVCYVLRFIPEPGEYQFRIEYELSDGHILSSETPIVTLY